MKIIKKGKIPPPEEYEGTCGKCKTEIECTRDEVKGDYDQRDGSSWHTAKCPICGCLITMKIIRRK